MALPAQAEDDPAQKFEGAVGLVATYGPDYAGAAGSGFRFVPAGFVRFGRFTLSGAGGFTTRRNDDVERGVAASLIDNDDWRVSVALRYDNGRNESNSEVLAGMGDIDPTVRAKLIMRWTPAPGWSLQSGVNVDALGQGGGWWADFGVSRVWRLTPETRLSLGSTVSYGGATYLQTWFGVSPEQATRSGHAVFKPAAGLRDVTLGTSLRSEFGPRWAGFVSAGTSFLLGPAADSPLTFERHGWSLGSGLVWRF
jgi:outer membrane scaffolding protein for murein synthesis (MipA/OmpV family)